jgi:hypothetical protein
MSERKSVRRYRPRGPSPFAQAKTDVQAQAILWGLTAIATDLGCRDSQPGDPCRYIQANVMKDRNEAMLTALIRLFIAAK